MNSKDGRDRYEAYKNTLKQADIGFPEEYIRFGNYGPESGYKEACCLLGMKERPTAILAANDQMATGVLRAASELKVRVPEELSVMGFDDIDAASWSIPALTTVRQPSYEVGAYSVKFLQQLIQNQGKTGKVNNKSFETKLIVRESVLDRI